MRPSKGLDPKPYVGQLSLSMLVGSESPTHGLRARGKASGLKRGRLPIFSEGLGMNPFDTGRLGLEMRPQPDHLPHTVQGKRPPPLHVPCILWPR